MLMLKPLYFGNYILNLEQKLSSVTFFVVDEINIIFSRRFSTNIKLLMRDNTKSLFILNQIYSQKL